MISQSENFELCWANYCTIHVSLEKIISILLFTSMDASSPSCVCTIFVKLPSQDFKNTPRSYFSVCVFVFVYVCKCLCLSCRPQQAASQTAETDSWGQEEAHWSHFPLQQPWNHHQISGIHWGASCIRQSYLAMGLWYVFRDNNRSFFLVYCIHVLITLLIHLHTQRGGYIMYSVI